MSPDISTMLRSGSTCRNDPVLDNLSDKTPIPQMLYRRNRIAVVLFAVDEGPRPQIPTQ
jgi:hypothetical protein